MTGNIREFVESCPVCQTEKIDHTLSRGMLQSTAITEKKWSEVSLDFITDLPITKNKKDSILTVVDSTTAVTVPSPPVHSVRPAGPCSDTVYDAHAHTLACSAKLWTRDATQRSTTVSQTINGAVVSKDIDFCIKLRFVSNCADSCFNNAGSLYQRRIWRLGRKLHCVCAHVGARTTRSEKMRREEEEGTS